MKLTQLATTTLSITLTIGFAACATTTQSVKEPADPMDLRARARQQAIADMMRNFERVQFAFDSFLIEDDGREALMENVAIMRRFQEIQLEVEGHCDELGSTEYNLALGQRRAEAIRKYMSVAGVKAARIATISYGEEIPLVDGQPEEDTWARNRRAEFRIKLGANDHVQGTVAGLDEGSDLSAPIAQR